MKVKHTTVPRVLLVLVVFSSRYRGRILTTWPPVASVNRDAHLLHIGIRSEIRLNYRKPPPKNAAIWFLDPGRTALNVDQLYRDGASGSLFYFKFRLLSPTWCHDNQGYIDILYRTGSVFRSHVMHHVANTVSLHMPPRNRDQGQLTFARITSFYPFFRHDEHWMIWIQYVIESLTNKRTMPGRTQEMIYSGPTLKLDWLVIWI